MSEMAARKPEVHHVAPRCLFTLHERAHGTSLDGKGIQAWVEWEMEAMRWGVPIEISQGELEALVDRSAADSELYAECPGCRSTSTSSKALQTTSKGKERA